MPARAIAREPIDRARVQRRTLRTLRAAQVFGGIGQAVGGSAGALLAHQITGSDGAAGWPQASLTAGAAVAALVVSLVAERTTRQLSLAAALVTGAVGAAVAASSALMGSLPLLLAGSTLLGAGNAAVMLARYAATDLADDGNRGGAVATVLLATSVGAAAGPNLLAPAAAVARLLGMPAFAGPYLTGAVTYLLAAATLAALLRPDPLVCAKRLVLHPYQPETSSTWRLVRRRRSLVAAISLGIANLVMVGLMAMAPLEVAAMGHGLGVIGAVVSLHITAMFAPSAISGRVTDRIGGVPAIAVGGAVLATSTALAGVSVHDTTLLTVAVVLLGAGWNITVVAATAVITAATPPSGRPKLEAAGEVVMGLAAAVGGALSGLIVAACGYSSLSIFYGGVALPLLAAPAFAARRERIAIWKRQPPAAGGRRS